MSNVTIHLVFPVLLLLATRLFPTRQVLLFAPFAVVPDLDTAVNLLSYHLLGETGIIFAHRSMFHNVFIFLPTLVLAVFLWTRMQRGAPRMAGWSWYAKWIAFGGVRWGYASVLVTFYLFTHILLDTFTGGTTLLWPLVDVYVYPRIILFVDMATGQPSVAASVASGQGAPRLVDQYAWLTPEQVAIWILVVMGTVAALAREAVVKRSPGGEGLRGGMDPVTGRAVPPASLRPVRRRSTGSPESEEDTANRPPS